MDQLVQQVNQEKSQILQCSFPIKWQDKTYTTSLSVADHRLEICITQEDQYLFQWKEKYSVNQFYKIHEFFLQLKNLQQFYEIFQKLMKNSVLSISLKDSRMIVQFEFEQLIGKTKFDIQLIQCEMNSKDVNLKMNQKIVNLEINHQKQLEQIIKDNQGQTEQIKNLSNQIEQMKDCFIKNIEVLNLDHQNQIQKLQNESNSQKQFPCSDIITQDEQEIVKKWISDKQISLKLIYKATINGFQIKKIYEQCKNKSKVVLLIKTNEGKRFGFYADCQIKIYNDYIIQNPNNIFLFSLDLKQKYTSNQSNCSNAFYSCGSYMAVGGGHDLALCTNSNSNNNSYVKSYSYGKKEGLREYALNGGIKNFTASEVQIFEII